MALGLYLENIKKNSVIRNLLKIMLATRKDLDILDFFYVGVMFLKVVTFILLTGRKVIICLI